MFFIGSLPVPGPSENSNLNPVKAIHTDTKDAITIRNKTNGQSLILLNWRDKTVTYDHRIAKVTVWKHLRISPAIDIAVSCCYW